MAAETAATRQPVRPGLGNRSPNNTRSNSKHDLEPNPFEQSFSSGDRKEGSEKSSKPSSVKAEPAPNAEAESESKDKNKSSPTNENSTPKPLLPPLASITSPSPNDSSSYPWGGALTGSLRAGPLSPAMLAGPQSSTNAFDPNFRTGFTPDLSNFKTGLTPLGSGPIAFPPPSPNTAAFLAMVTNSSGPSASGATITPNTLSALTGGPGAISQDQHPGVSSQPQSHLGARSHEHPNQFDLAFGRSYSGDKPGTKLRNSSTATDDSSKSVSPQMMQQSLNGYSNGRHGGEQQQQTAAASGLFLLSQAHQELTKREDAAAAAAAAAHALAAVGHAPQQRSDDRQLYDSPSTSNKGATKGGASGGGAGARGGKKRKGTSAAATESKGEGPSNGKANKKARASRAVSQASAEGPGKDDSDSDGDEHYDDDDGKGDGSRKPGDDEEKRKNFLERNRQAALKCRQRKKAWLASLQAKVEYLQTDNENLQNTVGALRNEIMYLKTQLMQFQDQKPGMPPPNVSMAASAPMLPPGVPMPSGMHAPGPGGQSMPLSMAGGGPSAVGTVPGASPGTYQAHAVPRPSHLPPSTYAPQQQQNHFRPAAPVEG